MDKFLANWRTTLSGVVMILLGICSLLSVHIVGQQPIDPQVALGMIVGGIGLIFGKDAHIGDATKKIVLLAFGISATLALLAGPPVRAADNLPASTAVTAINSALSVGSACTPASCSGPYIGGLIGGSGTNADILGSGINNSIFAAGGIVGMDAGYQYWSNNWFAAGEAAINYEFNTQATVNSVSGNGNGFLAYQIAKFGGNINALFNGQSAVTIPPTLANAVMAPYVLLGGVERPFATGWATGAGVGFDVGAHSFLDVKYMHVQYGPSSNGAFNLSNENLIFVGWNYKF